MINPDYRSQSYYNSGTWRATWIGEGGGVLINQAPHGIDLFMLLGGMPSRVTARVRTRLHDIEVEDEADALLEYPNGAWVNLHKQGSYTKGDRYLTSEYVKYQVLIEGGK